MFRVVRIELYGSILRALRWWKFILFLLITGLFVIIVREDAVKSVNLNMYKLYAPFWACHFLKPKISKINYLLPGDAKSRMIYLKYIFWSMLILFILWFGVIYLIAFLTGGVSGLYAMKRLLGSDIILITYFCICCIMTAYEVKEKRQHTKKNKIRQVIWGILFVYSLLHAAFMHYILSGDWYTVSIVIAYLFTILLLRDILSRIEMFDTSYESIKRPFKQSA